MNIPIYRRQESGVVCVDQVEEEERETADKRCGAPDKRQQNDVAREGDFGLGHRTEKCGIPSMLMLEPAADPIIIPARIYASQGRTDGRN
jgi:hypothetical protein